MTRDKPVLQFYGQLHALSSRGLHVRESARSWKLVVPLSPELLDQVRAVCERVALADAARVLWLLEYSLGRQADRGFSRASQGPEPQALRGTSCC